MAPARTAPVFVQVVVFTSVSMSIARSAAFAETARTPARGPFAATAGAAAPARYHRRARRPAAGRHAAHDLVKRVWIEGWRSR